MGRSTKAGRSISALGHLLVCLSVLALIASFAAAQGGMSRLFDEANVLYQQGDYAAALEKYSQIEGLGVTSSTLLYNIANCNYKLDQIGRAILYYERALALDPGDEDIEANLDIANQATVDKIAAPPGFALARWLKATLYLLPFDTVIAILAAFYLVSTALLISVILLRRDDLRKASRIALFGSIGLVLLFAVLAGLQWWDSNNRIEAIIQVEQVTVRSSPGDGATEVFTIHEGTKVRIDQQTNGWIEIVLSDGKVGWIRADSVERI